MINYFESGKIQSEYIYVNGKKNGMCKEYYENEQIKSQCEFFNGKKNGHFTTWYENGTTRRLEVTYINGNKEGYLSKLLSFYKSVDVKNHDH